MTTTVIRLALLAAICVESVYGSGKERTFKRETRQQPVYTASWAVKISEGGDKMAAKLANRYGFKNLGAVGEVADSKL